MWVYGIVVVQRPRFLGRCVFRFALDFGYFVFIPRVGFRRFHHLGEHKFVLLQRCRLIGN